MDKFAPSSEGVCVLSFEGSLDSVTTCDNMAGMVTTWIAYNMPMLQEHFAYLLSINVDIGSTIPYHYITIRYNVS